MSHQSVAAARSAFMRLVCHGLFAACALAARGAEKARPNIVFIMADDHAWQALSAYGDERKLIQTPNIDRIGKEGMRFDRCYVTNSLCGPARAAILTGTYSHINGFYSNSSKFDGGQVTFPKLLREAGYQTALFGKWHLETEPTGFDQWEILPGQGDYYHPVMIRPEGRARREGYVTDIITDLSLDWLKQRDTSKPFMLLCWQKAPHRNWQPPLKDLDFDKGREYPLPANFKDDYSGRGKAERDQNMTIRDTMTLKADNKLQAPANLNPEQRRQWNEYYVPRNKVFRESNLTGDDLVKWKYNRFMHDYLACVKGVDDNVGRILQYLDESGLSENTIVIYSSDQGFFLGEHGWFDKRWIFEESARTPLLVRWPGVAKAESTCGKIVSNLDLPETLLEAAGVPIPGRMQGRSLVPLLKGESPADWRGSFYYHYYEYPGGHRVRPHEGLITERFTLARFYWPDVDEWELFDRQADPHQMRNVLDEPALSADRERLMAEFTRLRAELKVPDKVDPVVHGR